MNGYAQMTIRRNRDGTFVVITESADVDPEYRTYTPGYWWDALKAANYWLEGNVDEDSRYGNSQSDAASKAAP